MKNKWALLVLSAPLFVLFTAMKMSPSGGNPTKLNVEMTTTSGLRVQLAGQNHTGSKLHLKLFRDERTGFGYRTETVFYTERIAADETEFNRTLNLSQLESGVYELEIRSGKERIVRRLEIGAKPSTTVEPARVVSLK